MAEKTQEEALDRQFKEDPGRVYATITTMAAEDPDNVWPKYKEARNEDQASTSKGVFSDFVEAEWFWKNSAMRGGLGMKIQNGSRK